MKSEEHWFENAGNVPLEMRAMYIARFHASMNIYPSKDFSMLI